MPCYTPITGYLSRSLTQSGKRGVVFTPSKGFIDRPVNIPCGQCIGCRLEKSRQWAVRCVHEASLHENNAFLTITYNDENIPWQDTEQTLVKRDIQLFMKRLRKEYGEGVRFYACGEYGEQNKRPHYHLILFNINITDKEIHSIRQGTKLYRSKTIEKLWTRGFSTIGEVTFESAAYVARYVTKKITGEQSEEHYNGRLPEFALMSRRPGIGKGWLEKFYQDIYVKDELILRNGKKMKPPIYYDKLYDNITGNLSKIKLYRKIKAEKHKKEFTYERRMTKMELQKIKLRLLKRKIEVD